MVRGLWRFVLFDVSRVQFLFFLEFQRWTEKVVEQTPFVLVEVIDHRNEVLVVEAVIAEQLPDMGPVFLFNEGVVVLSVWT